MVILSNLITLIPSRGYQRTFGLTSWAIALAMTGAVRLGLAASVCCWALFHYNMSKLFRAAFGETKNAFGYFAWAPLTSMVNGLLVQPLLLALSFRGHLGGEAISWQALDSFLRLPWDGVATWPLEQAMCCICGYVLREWALYPDGLEVPYLIHHLVACVGCSHHLFVPVGAGLVCFNAIQCEATSALFSMYEQFPSTRTAVLYRCSMSASGLVGFYFTAVFWSFPAPLACRLMYLVLAVALVAIRTGGLVVDVQKYGLLGFPGAPDTHTRKHKGHEN